MTKKEFENLKERQLLTIKNSKGHIVDILHFSKWIELRHHNYNGESWYYLSIALQPKLENVSITTESDIIAYYERKKAFFEEQLKKILDLKNDL